LAEFVECLLEVSGFDGDFVHRVVEVQRAGDGVFDFVVGGVADERVAGADIEINVRQRLDAEVVASGVS
jgi:hypothetical protein